VEKGANVNVAINKGTPLITIAVVMDHAGFVQFLIENGADVNVKDSASHQMTPLMSAAQEGYLDIVKSLVQAKASLEDRNDAGMTALIHASKMGRDDVVQYLLESGADPNARDNNGMTALMHAASEYAGSRLTIKPDIKEGRKIKLDHVIVATSLLEKGADPMVKRNDGKTALMLVQDSISKRSKETSFSAEEVQKIYFNDMIQVLSGAETRKDKGQ
jgi:ankyrin repeat protein